MAKKKKQRKVDFTKEEIMDMSQRGSVQDLDYRLKKMKSYYGLDTSGFKTDSEGSGTESFFPAECGELLFAGILISILPEEQKVRQRM